MNPALLYRVRDMVNVAMKALVALCRRGLDIHLAGCWDCSLCQFCKSKSVCAYEFTDGGVRIMLLLIQVIYKALDLVARVTEH